jgi:hypothetical protein
MWRKIMNQSDIITKDELLLPGYKLDAIVAETVMGLQVRWVKDGTIQARDKPEVYLKKRGIGNPYDYDGWWECPHFSRRIEAAWAIVEKLRQEGWLFVVKVMPDGHSYIAGNDPTVDPKITRRSVCEMMYMPSGSNADLRKRLHNRPRAIADTEPMAICKAALMAYEQEKDNVRPPNHILEVNDKCSLA